MGARKSHRQPQYLLELVIEEIALSFPASLRVVGEALHPGGLSEVTLRADARTPLGVALCRPAGLVLLIANDGVLSRAGFEVPAPGGPPESWSLNVTATGITTHWGPTLVDAAWQRAEAQPPTTAAHARGVPKGTWDATLVAVTSRGDGRSAMHVLASGNEAVVEIDGTTALDLEVSEPAMPSGSLHIDARAVRFASTTTSVHIVGDVRVARGLRAGRSGGAAAGRLD